MNPLERKYLDQPLCGRVGSAEYNRRIHFKERMAERVGIEISDSEYYALSAIAARRALTRRDAGHFNPEQPDRIYIRLSVRGRLFEAVYDFLDNHLVTVIQSYPRHRVRSSDIY